MSPPRGRTKPEPRVGGHRAAGRPRGSRVGRTETPSGAGGNAVGGRPDLPRRTNLAAAGEPDAIGRGSTGERRGGRPRGARGPVAAARLLAALAVLVALPLPAAGQGTLPSMTVRISWIDGVYGEMDVGWGPVNGAASYRVEWGRSGGALGSSATVTTTSHVIGPLETQSNSQPGLDYTVRVTALDGSGVELARGEAQRRTPSFGPIGLRLDTLTVEVPENGIGFVRASMNPEFRFPTRTSPGLTFRVWSAVGARFIAETLTFVTWAAPATGPRSPCPTG